MKKNLLTVLIPGNCEQFFKTQNMNIKRCFILPLIFGIFCNCTKQKILEKNKIAEKEILKPVQIDSFEIDYQKLDLKPFINKMLLGKEQITGNPKETEYFTRYIGIIEVGKINYHVLSQFYAVQAAVSKHGHSRIMLLDKNIKIRKIYELSMPDELPSAIRSNELIWIMNNKKYSVNLGAEIPQMICIPNNKGCY